jgi:hypothetical protein
MPKLKNYGKGKRVNIWLLEKQLKRAEEIDNFSAFVQIAVDNAVDIMAWAILKGYDPKKFNVPRDTEKVIAEFNEKYPQDELTQKRNGTWRKSSAKKPELW